MTVPSSRPKKQKRESKRHARAEAAGPLCPPVYFSASEKRSTSRVKRPHVVVVGAGAFGGWSALHLLRRGARVTLLDAWGPGNSRASSGGETRVIRATYGPDPVYAQMMRRSLRLWQENQAQWNIPLFRGTGVLWMTGSDDEYEKRSMSLMLEAGLAPERLSLAVLKKRYRQINFEGVKWAIYEKDAGYLLARQACQCVVDAFVREGGDYRQLAATPGVITKGEMQGLKVSNGSTVQADRYLFACGPWLAELFPKIIRQRVKASRQEVFFFGTPAGDSRFAEGNLPVWVDHSQGFQYGIPGNERRGFKVADDTPGPAFNPTHGDRMPSARGLAAVRRYLAFRFPALKAAPLIESRVCQYENTPDRHFIIDVHPEAGNTWLAGGGSGHGFKHGPAVGERVAGLVLGQLPVDPFFALSRFRSQ